MRAAASLIAFCTQPAFGQSTHENCVDVQVGTAQSYDCINQKLQAISREAHQPPSSAAPDIGTIPANQTGQFNENAIRDRLGANYGKSVIPPQPAPNIPKSLSKN
jgi:hypothetical protein